MVGRKIILFLLAVLYGLGLSASPVSWQFKLVDKGNGEAELQCDALIEMGWHLYDTEMDEGGPYPTGLNIDELKGATAVGKFKSVNSSLHKEFDNIFGMEVGYYNGRATFVQRFQITNKAIFVLKGDVRAQACNDEECTPPLPIEFAFSAADLPATLVIQAATTTEQPKVEPIEVAAISIDSTTIDSTAIIHPIELQVANTDLWQPVVEELKSFGTEGKIPDKSLFALFGIGFLGGLIALLTPCVWPMIPMTVSFFLKRNKRNKAKAICEAFTYSLAIIIIYVALGLLSVLHTM
jgi:thiol:disulfide interchange protein DsbD